MQYYVDRATEFFERTVGVDTQAITKPFVDRLPPGAHILDAGCGSGRDSRFFLQQGFALSAMDASPVLAKMAADHIQHPVLVRRFEEVNEVGVYDGIWACASLLHVPAADLPSVMQKLWAALKPGGLFYCSFKLGQGERVSEGRHFTDADERRLIAWLEQLKGVGTAQFWRTLDQRADSEQVWVNTLVDKLAD